MEEIHEDAIAAGAGGHAGGLGGLLRLFGIRVAAEGQGVRPLPTYRGEDGPACVRDVLGRNHARQDDETVAIQSLLLIPSDCGHPPFHVL